jgi:hypothetical protein
MQELNEGKLWLRLLNVLLPTTRNCQEVAVHCFDEPVLVDTRRHDRWQSLVHYLFEVRLYSLVDRELSDVIYDAEDEKLVVNTDQERVIHHIIFF